VLTLTTYQCEICGDKFREAEHALACEAKGVFDRSKCYPVGMILASNGPGDLYEKMTFSVASYGEANGKHSAYFSMWACRDESGYGDSLWEQTCGCHDHHDLNSHYANIDHTRPSFQRMMTYLKSRGIPVTVWNGSAPVPVEDWLRSKSAG
jgi:hypothetical protein